MADGPDPDQLLTLAETYGSATGKNRREIARAAGVPGIFGRIRTAMSVAPVDASIALRWFAANWPDDVPWPGDIPRPKVVYRPPPGPDHFRERRA